LAFSRPIRWLLALLGDEVVPVQVSNLHTGRRTYLQRGTQDSFRDVPTAADLLALHRSDGIITDPVERRAEVARQVQALAAEAGGLVDLEGESALLGEVTNLVEAPHAILGSFDTRYLELPAEVLTTVMRKHQRYFPVVTEMGELLARFVAVANGECVDDVVRAGNESVLRARYEDAAFFYQADLQVPLKSFRDDLTKLTFEERIGTVADRATRIAAVATDLADQLGVDESTRQTLHRAGELVHFDLATSMVVELSSLAGTIAREYAQRAGENDAVATALYEVSQPRAAGGDLPKTLAGALLSLADRADLLVAMLSLGSKVTGSSDPFGLRRAALGIVRVLADRDDLADLDLPAVLQAAAARLRADGVDVADSVVGDASSFAAGRFEQLLRAEGTDATLNSTVDLHNPHRGAALLVEIASLRHDPAFGRLVAALNRIARMVPDGTPAIFDVGLLHVPSDAALLATVESLPDCSRATLGHWTSEVGDLGGVLERYFEDTLVMADDAALRASRLGLLQTVVDRAPHGVRWRDLGSLL
jgi:glycyl-tRNA synthetase